jgi:hypothetical protein
MVRAAKPILMRSTKATTKMAKEKRNEAEADFADGGGCEGVLNGRDEGSGSHT